MEYFRVAAVKLQNQKLNREEARNGASFSIYRQFKDLSFICMDTKMKISKGITSAKDKKKSHSALKEKDNDYESHS
ncbi:hypothetical protein Back11_48420 [Paenibacillus baekrokdamisoli]|uniref:Uncharacterized protein n=1 Tax=Paenibacillus baekrokdamisoli TaxID=1712516 RepID=A0A3G9IX56_9BACL|nr:hypothetical protein [Paenibacillus baekrokdamisoli]MBB3068665.1 hypothetical protein [Paenibacillus baekrokdamisoli]BBH23497.1 hypothetical protein Back11_48420 [Paenibacillus baekrokdamisoli]